MTDRDKDKDDESFLLCLPVGMTNLIVPGSLRKRCFACDQAIWVSRASLDLAETRNVALLCLPCAQERTKDDEDVEIEMPTPEQIREMLRTLSENN